MRRRRVSRGEARCCQEQWVRQSHRQAAAETERQKEGGAQEQLESASGSASFLPLQYEQLRRGSMPATAMLASQGTEKYDNVAHLAKCRVPTDKDKKKKTSESTSRGDPSPGGRSEGRSARRRFLAEYSRDGGGGYDRFAVEEFDNILWVTDAARFSDRCFVARALPARNVDYREMQVGFFLKK